MNPLGFLFPKKRAGALPGALGFPNQPGHLLDTAAYQQMLSSSQWAYAQGLVAQPPKPTQRLVNEESSSTELLAMRGWRLDFSPYCGVRLRSLHVDVVWEGPTLIAHGDPEQESTGVHAAKTEKWATEFSRYAALAPVWGVVALSGKVVEGTTGYRAERATVQSLVLHQSFYRTSKELNLAGLERMQRDPSMSRFGAVFGPLAPEPLCWPDTLSVFEALSQLEERYQCDVSLAPSLAVA